MSTKRPCRLRERINIELLRGLDFGDDDDSPLLLADNYNRTVTGQPQSAQSSQRTRKEIRGSLRLDDPCKAVSWPRPALAPGRCLSGQRRSSGHTGLPGGGDWEAGGRSGQDHRFTRRRYRREVPIREGQLWATAPIRQAGPAGTRSHLGAGGRSGLRGRWRWRSDKAAFPGGWILGKQSLRFSIIII